MPAERRHTANENRIIRDIKKQFGSVIDLDRSPLVMIEILRRFRFDLDGGSPPGGTPEPQPAPSPPGPGSPTSLPTAVTNEDLMKEILKLSRQLAQIRKQLGLNQEGELGRDDEAGRARVLSGLRPRWPSPGRPRTRLSVG